MNFGRLPEENHPMTMIREQMGPDSTDRTVIVLTTWPADRDPFLLANPLVEERFAACVNVLPVMDSFYRWEGTLHRDPERQIVMKTTASRLEALHARLRSLHPYDVPEFIVIDA